MFSNRMLAPVVVALVVLAGCSGSGVAPDDADGARGGSSADGSAARGQPDGGIAGEQSDGEPLDLSDPEAALRDAGSFAVTWRYAGVDASGVETEVSREFYADLRGERVYTVTSSMRDGRSDGAAEQFVAGGVTYVRSGSGEDATYVSYEGTTDVTDTALALSQARTYGAGGDLAHRGSETFDGVAVDRYELSGASSSLIRAGSAAAADSADDIEITDFEYVVLVDGDGLPRYESWSFAGRTSAGEAVSGAWEYSLTGVGSTAVEDPDWLVEATAGSGV